MDRRLHQLRAPAPGATGASGQDAEEAGGAARPPAGLRRPLPRQRDQGDPGPVAPQDAGPDGAGRGGGRRDRPAVQMAAGRQETQPADRDDGEGQRGLRRPGGAGADRSHPLQRRPDRASRGERQRQVDLRQADRRPAAADGRQDGAGGEARERLLRPASGGRPRARRHALHPCRRADARRGGVEDPRPGGADRLFRRRAPTPGSRRCRAARRRGF